MLKNSAGDIKYFVSLETPDFLLGTIGIVN